MGLFVIVWVTGVLVTTGVAVGVTVDVAVGVTVGVTVEVAIEVAVEVAIGVAVEVAIGVAVGEALSVIFSAGAIASNLNTAVIFDILVGLISHGAPMILYCTEPSVQADTDGINNNKIINIFFIQPSQMLVD